MNFFDLKIHGAIFERRETVSVLSDRFGQNAFFFLLCVCGSQFLIETAQGCR